MFIELGPIQGLRSNGAKSMLRGIQPPIHCAPLERKTVVGCEVYRHLAPLEPGTIGAVPSIAGRLHPRVITSRPPAT